MDEDILDIFYNSIIPEASNGRIDCFMYYNICFNTSVEGNVIKGNNPSFIDPPLLEIRDKESFDDLLKEYVTLAKEFYDDSYFYDEVLSGIYRTDENKLSKEKVLMTLLWSNATIEDFQEPCSFLRRQKKYLERNFLTEKKNIGYSEILDGNIITEISKTLKLSWESPYAFHVTIANEKEKYDLPTVRFGVEDDIVYIYSIHQEKNINKSKKINRNLYKVNENFNNSEDDTLKDITPSFLVALDLFVLHFNNLGYSKFKIVNYLPERWIDKKIMIHKKSLKANDKTATYKDYMEKLVRVQNNLVQKFCSTLLRLQYHYGDGIIVNSYPFEFDSYLSFSCNDLSFSNNRLFQEMSYLYQNNHKRHI